MYNQQENIVALAKIAGLLLLMTFTFVVLAMCERHQETELAKKEFKKHINKTYVIGNDTISIDSNLNVKK